MTNLQLLSESKYRESNTKEKKDSTPTIPGGVIGDSGSNGLVRANSSGDEEFERKKGIINEMMEITGQEKDVCLFYLESADWNLNKAVDTFTSMTS